MSENTEQTTTKKVHLTSQPLTHSLSQQANLWIVAVSLVQDLDDNIYLVHLSIVSELFPHTAEDLGERSLAQTLPL